MDEQLQIYTATNPDDAGQFRRMKRRKWGEWKFVVSGESSAAPWHSADYRFYAASTPDRRYWALLNVGFPKRILAVAHAELDMPLEIVVGRMMRRLADEHGPCIEFATDNGDDIDDDLLWDTCNAAQQEFQ